MKCLLVSFTVLLLSQIEWVKGVPGFAETIQQCKNQTKANEDEVNSVLAHRLPKTENEKCMLACVAKKIEFMGVDNKANLEKILKSISHIKHYNKERYEKIKKTYEDCVAAEIAEKDECLAAFHFAECVHSKQVELELIPRFENGKLITDICKNNTGANDEEIKNVSRREIPTTKKEQCMLACIMKKRGAMTADNKIDLDKLKEPLLFMRKHNSNMYNKTVQVFEVCKTAEKKETDECIAAKTFAECTYPKERINHLGDRMKIVVNECSNKTKASELEVDAILRHHIPKSTPEKCMFACIQKKVGTMKADNTMDIEKLKKNFKHLKTRNPEFYEEIEKVLDECKAKETKQDNECVAAGNFAECLYPKEKEIRDALMKSNHH